MPRAPSPAGPAYRVNGKARRPDPAFFLLLLAVIAAYGNGLGGVFQFDDYTVIVADPAAHSLSAWFEDLGHGLRPLLKLSYALNWLAGPGERGFHVVNLALHLAASVLVYRLSSRIFDGRRGTALTAALIFAVHPIASEAVTYISGRSMALMTVLYLASVLVYVRGVEDNRASLARVGSPLLFLAAVASKETALLLPFSLVLWNFCFRGARTVASLFEKQSVHWCSAAVAGVVLIMLPRYWHLLEFSARIHPVATNALTQLNAMTWLLGQWLFPWPLNIDPDLPVVGDWRQGLPDLALWSVLAIAAVMARRTLPVATFAILWFLLHLFPLHVFFPRLDVVNERHLYLAGWPWVLPAAALLGRLSGKPRLAASATLLVVLAASSVARNQDYHSEVALWERTARLSPRKSRVQNNLGYAYALRCRTREAERAFLAALRLDPGNLRAAANLANLANGCSSRCGRPSSRAGATADHALPDCPRYWTNTCACARHAASRIMRDSMKPTHKDLP